MDTFNPVDTRHVSTLDSLLREKETTYRSAREGIERLIDIQTPLHQITPSLVRQSLKDANDQEKQALNFHATGLKSFIQYRLVKANFDLAQQKTIETTFRAVRAISGFFSPEVQSTINNAISQAEEENLSKKAGSEALIKYLPLLRDRLIRPIEEITTQRSCVSKAFFDECIPVPGTGIKLSLASALTPIAVIGLAIFNEHLRGLETAGIIGS